MKPLIAAVNRCATQNREREPVNRCATQNREREPVNRCATQKLSGAACKI
jgi:hypothetical protein